MSKIRIAIADDYAIIRDGLKVGLARDDNFEVVLEAESGEELVEGIARTEVDVVLLDLRMPGMDGMEATTVIRQRFGRVKILAVTMYDDEKFIIHLMEKGANGYLLKNADSDEIRKAIYAVHETGYYFNDLVNKALLRKLVIRGNIKPNFNSNVELTERELQVLDLLHTGQSNREIAVTLGIEERTVKSHVAKLLKKMGVKNRTALIMQAIGRNLVRTGVRR